MEVDWERIDYESFSRIIPKIVQVFFGMELEFERNADYQGNLGDSFAFRARQRRLLGVVHREKRLSMREISELIPEIMRMEASAGLIISASSQPFRVWLIERSNGCWFPIAVWGQRQIDAIASMNGFLFSEIIPFFERLSHRHRTVVSTELGRGGVLASDIVEFVQLGINIGAKISVDPAKVRTRIIRDINRCFNTAGNRNASYWQKVGSDGWFHFYKDSLDHAVIDLALNCTAQIRKVSSRFKQYQGQSLKVVMGINSAQNVQLDPQGGGPLDDDSIISFRLLEKDFRKYDIRATREAVLNLVDPSKHYEWTHYEVLEYPGRGKIEIHGHA